MGLWIDFKPNSAEYERHVRAIRYPYAPRALLNTKYSTLQVEVEAINVSIL